MVPMRRLLDRSALGLLLLLVSLAGCDEEAPLVDAGPAPTDAGPRADAGGPPEDRDGFIEWHMQVGGIPGLAAAIVRPGAVEWIGTYGYADIESDRPVDEHTLFIMASVSKTIAAVRAMQLVEAGALDLDAPVETYVPEALRHPGYPDTPITLRMLLTHVSGLVDDFITLAEATYTMDPPMSLGEFTRAYAIEGGSLYAADHWGAQPVTAHSYCNAGYGVVGYVLEGAGGESLRTQTERDVFAPLAMDGAGWFLADVEAARLATPYGYNGRSFEALPQNGFAFYPASSLRVSVTGLARFARMLLNRGELDGTRVLEAASVDELFRLQYPSLSSRQALTFRRRSVGGHAYIGHSGSTFGGSIQLLLSVDGAHAILLITNSDAYVRDRVGFPDGADAMEAILERLDADAG